MTARTEATKTSMLDEPTEPTPGPAGAATMKAVVQTEYGASPECAGSTRELDLRSCAVTCRGEGHLNECRCRRLVVGPVTVPFHGQAVRAIDFDVAAGGRSPAKVKVERVPRPRSRQEMKRWMASLAWS